MNAPNKLPESLIVGSRDIETLVICSVRYALGRQTYMPSEVQRIARECRGAIGTMFLEQFARDIDHAIRTGFAGADCDVKGWHEFARWCESVAAERKAKP